MNQTTKKYAGSEFYVGTKLILVPIFVLMLFFIVPIAQIISSSFLSPSLTLDNYVRIFSSSVYLEVIWITLRISLVVTFSCLLIGYPFALFLHKLQPKTRKALMVLAILPLWINPLAFIQGWRIILQREGIVNRILMEAGIIVEPLQLIYNLFAVSLVMVYLLVPFMTLPIYASLKQLDLNLVKASQNLGASPFQTFRRVIFPMTLSGVQTGMLLVFILAMGYFVTPTLLGGRSELVISRVIDEQINRLFNWGFGSALTVLLFLVIITLFLIMRFIPRREFAQTLWREFYVGT